MNIDTRNSLEISQKSKQYIHLNLYRRKAFSLKKTLAMVLVGVLILTILAPTLLTAMGGYLIVTDPLKPADAVVALSGDTHRILYALNLHEQGYADDMWLTKTSTLHRATERGLPVDEAMVVPAETMVESTYDEAIAIRTLACREQYMSVIIVTSPYHSRRTHLIFHRLLEDTGITVMVVPVAGHPDTAATWWSQRSGWRKVMGEFTKLTYYALSLEMPQIPLQDRAVSHIPDQMEESPCPNF
jgi:uncharacterized SAM-binding protein YcdF (DUF218 family)